MPSWPGHGEITEDRFRELRRQVWSAYNGPHYASIRLLPHEVDAVRAYLRLMLGAPDTRGAGGGMLWSAAGIMLAESPTVQWVTGIGRPAYYHVMETVYRMVEPEVSDNDSR